VKQYGKIHELRRAIAGSQTGSHSQGNYFLEFSFGRGGSSSEIKSISSSDSSSEYSLEVFPGTVDSVPLHVSRDSLISSTIVSDIEVQSCVKIECDKEDEIEDHKVEIGDILEHSSGAALYERLLSSTREDTRLDGDIGEDQQVGSNTNEYTQNISLPSVEFSSPSEITNDYKALYEQLLSSTREDTRLDGDIGEDQQVGSNTSEYTPNISLSSVEFSSPSEITNDYKVLYEQLLSSTRKDTSVKGDIGGDQQVGSNTSEYTPNIPVPSAEFPSPSEINKDDKAGQNAAHLKEIRELQAARYNQEMQKKGGTSP
jgi:hypothetical protein